MTYSELERIIKKKTKCFILKEGTKHTLWKNPETGKMFTMPRHKTRDVKSKTLKSIMGDAGL